MIVELFDSEIPEIKIVSLKSVVDQTTYKQQGKRSNSYGWIDSLELV